MLIGSTQPIANLLILWLFIHLGDLHSRDIVVSLYHRVLELEILHLVKLLGLHDIIHLLDLTNNLVQIKYRHPSIVEILILNGLLTLLSQLG